VTGTNRFVLERNRAALKKLLFGSGHSEENSPRNSALRAPRSALSVRGHTDLAIDGRKFSGNAQRRRRRAVLFHGTFLLNFDLTLVDELLPMPSKQPEYRQSRSHGEFLRNLKVPVDAVKAALRQEWQADELVTDPPRKAIQALVTHKYGLEEWTLRIGA
jgi:lipoate-protein ligase A